MYIIIQQTLLSFQETSTTISFSDLRDLYNEILKWNMKSLQVVSQQEQKRMWQGKETAASVYRVLACYYISVCAMHSNELANKHTRKTHR